MLEDCTHVIHAFGAEAAAQWGESANAGRDRPTLRETPGMARVAMRAERIFDGERVLEENVVLVDGARVVDVVQAASTPGPSVPRSSSRSGSTSQPASPPSATSATPTTQYFAGGRPHVPALVQACPAWLRQAFR